MNDPEVKATLVTGRSVWLWVIKKCPWCGQKHTHGSGRLSDDPRKFLGHRFPHCPPEQAPLNEYVLIEDTNASDRNKSSANPKTQSCTRTG
jgi:hypothetical protein